MSDLFAKASAELADLDRKLAELIPLQRRREQLRAFVEQGRLLYEAERTGASAPGSIGASSINAETSPSVGAPQRRNTAKFRILEGAARLIEKHGPLRSRDLVRYLESEGVAIGGADKLIAVSTLLSREKQRFRSDREAGGWVLIQPCEEKTPLGAVTPAGS